jgi:hypothetical protein
MVYLRSGGPVADHATDVARRVVQAIDAVVDELPDRAVDSVLNERIHRLVEALLD